MKTILITGCSSGFGLETARYFLERDWNVIATMRSPREDLLPPSPRLRVLPLDVSQHAEVLAARDQLLSQWSGIDLVLVVAGAYNEMRVDSFQRRKIRRRIGRRHRRRRVNWLEKHRTLEIIKRHRCHRMRRFVTGKWRNGDGHRLKAAALHINDAAGIGRRERRNSGADDKAGGGAARNRACHRVWSLRVKDGRKRATRISVRHGTEW